MSFNRSSVYQPTHMKGKVKKDGLKSTNIRPIMNERKQSSGSEYMRHTTGTQMHYSSDTSFKFSFCITHIKHLQKPHLYLQSRYLVLKCIEVADG